MKNLRYTYTTATIILLILLVMITNISSNSGGDLDPQSFREKLESKPGVIIDVRTPQEYEEGHLADTKYLIDFLSDDFDDRIGELDKQETYYLYCRSGNRSGRAMEKMQQAGFREVYNVGGYEELVSSGFRPR